MKKKSIQKLKLKKASVSALNQSSLKGGTLPNTIVCESVNFCETRDYTRCYGERLCRFYDQNL